MDFQSLSRKDLQTLCKKNKIPANIASVAMAEALAALQEVAGIEEILSPIESESNQSEEIINNESPGNCRTACRTSTRRKPVKEEPPITQSIIRTRRGKVGELADQENKDLNIPSTPSLPSNRRRAPAPSARKKLEDQSVKRKEEEKDQNNVDQKMSDVLATPSMPKTQRKVSGLCSTRRQTEARMDKSSVQGACSTRRSMRLLEKTMKKLSLMEYGSVEPVVADKLFDELPERKESCEQKINEIDSNLDVSSIGEDDSKEALRPGVDDKSDDPKAMNETSDEEEEQVNDGVDSKESNEKVKMEDENEEDNTITCNKGENFSKEKVISTESSPLLQEMADLEITVQSEENSEIITEETVEFNNEDLVDINVEEVEFQYFQDSMLEPKMGVQVLSDGESSFKEMVELDMGELIDVDVVESGLVENSTQETCNVEEQVNDFESKDSFPEPKIDEDLRKSDGIPVEGNSIQETCNVEEQVNDFNSKDSFPEPKIEDLRKSDEVLVEDSDSFPEPKIEDLRKSDEVLVEDSDSFPEPKISDLRKSDEILVEDSEEKHNLSFTPFPVDQISGQFPRPTAEVLAQEPRTSIEIFDSADEDGDMRNNSNEGEEKNWSLRQLKKMVKEQLQLSKQSNKEKTYGKEQVEKVVRTALQPLSENCMANDGQ